MFGSSQKDNEVRSAILPSSGVHPTASGQDWVVETTDNGNDVLKGSFKSRKKGEEGREIRISVTLPSATQEGWLREKNERAAVQFGKMVRDAGIAVTESATAADICNLLNASTEEVFYVAFRRHTDMPVTGGQTYIYPGVAPSTKAEFAAFTKDPRSVSLPQAGQGRKGKAKPGGGGAAAADENSVDF